MKKDEILGRWLSRKIEITHRIYCSAYTEDGNAVIPDTAESWFAEIADTAQSWFLKCPGCETFTEWIEKHPDTVKPFHFVPTPLYWASRDFATSEKVLKYEAHRLAKLLKKVDLSSLDGNDFDAIEDTVERVGSFAAFFDGYSCGYEERVMDAKWPYKIGPGASSREAGLWTLNAARKVLEKYGGVPGYKALPRGKKKPVMEEIGKAIKAKDPRNIHNIINKIGTLPKEEN